MAPRPSRSIHAHILADSDARGLCALQHALFTREGAYLEADTSIIEVPFKEDGAALTEGKGTRRYCVRGTLTFTRETP